MTDIVFCYNCKRSAYDITRSLKHKNIYCAEKLCLDCEIIFYPERFHGCSFCKRPIKYNSCCTLCMCGFIDWIKQLINEKTTSKVASTVIIYHVKNMLKNMNESLNNSFICRNNDNFHKWPGFYCGLCDINMFDNKLNTINNCNDIIVNLLPLWIIPNIKSKITVNSVLKLYVGGSTAIITLLKNYNIDICSYIHIDINTINKNDINKINFYDTYIF
jgi:hypothetical protein